MNNAAIAKFGLRVLTYKCIDSNNKFNALAKYISQGAITRDKLAKRIISDTVSLAQHYVVANQSLGKRSAEIVNQGRSALFDNTRAQVEKGLAPLVDVILQSKGQGELARKIAAGITQYLGPALIQDHGVERVLGALTKYEGGENVLRLALENVFSGCFGGKMISATFMSALKRAIVDRPEYREGTRLYDMAAWKLYEALAPDPSQLPPPPTGLRTIEYLATQVPSMVTSVCQHLNTIQQYLQLPYNEQELSTVFTECWPSDLAVPVDISTKNFARVVMMGHATGQSAIVNQNIDALPKDIRQTLHQEAATIRTLLTRLPTPEIKVAQNWSGDIEVVSVQHTSAHPPSAQMQTFIDTQFRVPVHHPQEVNALVADGEFIKSLDKGINLKIDNSHLSYGRWLSDMGSQFIAQAKNSWMGQTGLSPLKQRQLEQLSQMVDNNPMSLLALSRYLIPESISARVQEQVFNQFEHQPPNLICVDKMWMKVGKPEVNFEVSKRQGVDIAIGLKWPVAEFGDAVETLSPSLAQQSHLSSTINVNILFNKHGVEKERMTLSDTHILLQDRLVFGSPSAKDVNASSPLLNQFTLNKLCEVASTC
ncbi:hypothetical protein SODG_002066 [Sodalis praecaptivus]|uniref:hypothetical protein n=1 Tax=Sodalis praecaptivus TaxID=1239307 RepID=UPI0027EC7AF8|nr:hypothetical protein [Sodalis praecaptivus]CAJ0996815.1 hypothetical protein NVIRENTERO_02571 [Sodalis praecaptivus]